MQSFKIHQISVLNPKFLILYYLQYNKLINTYPESVFLGNFRLCIGKLVFFSGNDCPKPDSLLSFFTKSSCNVLCFGVAADTFKGEED